MSGSLIDANVLLDIATADATWMAWSSEQVRSAAERGPVYINAIIYAEVAAGFATQQDLDRWLDPAVFQRSALPYDAGWLAAQAFVRYRRAGGVRNTPLPDFYIGAHAEVEQLTLVSRDAARYRTYFPAVTLIAP